MLQTRSILFSFLISAAVAGYAEDVPLVEIANGLLQGTFQKSYNGRVFSSFEGIPYARPPVGDLRFEAPQEPYNWTGTWVGNTKHTCLQPPLQPGHSAIIGDEDCLYINVYVPREKPSSSDNLNVIVHIHGGAFMLMSGHAYAGPKYLMDENVILVTMNYRLGVFGFLSTEDDVVPGNNGMKDQVMSLQWIQKNIKYFGGNPDSVTITGMSAGGASVHLHYFSPLSKGLFHRGVSQSGTAVALWVIQKSALENAERLAELVGCSTESSTELKDCLKSRSNIKIAEAALKLNAIDEFPLIMTFKPVIEIEHDGAFLTDDPQRMLFDKAVADLPWIVSIAEEEGHLFSIFDPTERFNEVVPYILYYNHMTDEKQSITDQIKQYYFSDTTHHHNTYQSAFADGCFAAPADISAKLQAKANKSPVYFSILGYRGQHTFAEYFFKDTEHIKLATHGDDCLYYLYNDKSEEVLSEGDEKMKSVYLRWLLSYANAGKPDVVGMTWKPVDGGEILEYLYIQGPDELHMETGENLGSSLFWQQLPVMYHEHQIFFKDEL